MSFKYRDYSPLVMPEIPASISPTHLVLSVLYCVLPEELQLC